MGIHVTSDRDYSYHLEGSGRSDRSFEGPSNKLRTLWDKPDRRKMGFCHSFLQRASNCGRIPALCHP